MDSGGEKIYTKFVDLYEICKAAQCFFWSHLRSQIFNVMFRPIELKKFNYLNNVDLQLLYIAFLPLR
jgi:hypothetical protein